MNGYHLINPEPIAGSMNVSVNVLGITLQEVRKGMANSRYLTAPEARALAEALTKAADIADKP